MINTFNFKFTDKIFKVAKLQVTQLKRGNMRSYYEDLSKSEYTQIKDQIHNPKTVLELGCGLGRMSIYMNYYLKDDSIKYILADFDVLKKHPKYSWGQGNQFYNKLELTREFCKLNNLTNIELFDLGKRKISELENIDIIMSFLAVGFHSPIEDYIKDLVNIISDNYVLFFGIRRGKYTEKSFEEYFENCKILNQTDVDTKEQILILKDKKF